MATAAATNDTPETSSPATTRRSFSCVGLMPRARVCVPIEARQATRRQQRWRGGEAERRRGGGTERVCQAHKRRSQRERLWHAPKLGPPLGHPAGGQQRDRAWGCGESKETYSGSHDGAWRWMDRMSHG